MTNKFIEEKVDSLLEKWADIEHTRWAKWQKYMHSLCTTRDGISGMCDTGELIIPADKVDRWERQIATEYKDLSEKEKESDREQVYSYLEDVKELIHQAQEQTRQKNIIKKYNVGVKRHCVDILNGDHYNMQHEDCPYCVREKTKQDIIEIMEQELLDYALPKPKTESDKVYNETLGEISEDIINKIEEM